MSINAKEVRYKNGGKKMLLAIFDVTEQERLEAEKNALLVQKDILLKEMRHRIANSLQLIASILILNAGMVKSDETRRQLEDAHDRIMSIATVQQKLDPAGVEGEIGVAQYLKVLCESLAKSMIGGRKPISLTVHAGKGTATPDDAISLGLMTTELVINALKHAFTDGRKGEVIVTYRTINKSGWVLSVSDNGVGYSKKLKMDQPGLGTGIVSALAEKLEAKVHTKSSEFGTIVSINYTGAKLKPI